MSTACNYLLRFVLGAYPCPKSWVILSLNKKWGENNSKFGCDKCKSHQKAAECWEKIFGGSLNSSSNCMKVIKEILAENWTVCPAMRYKIENLSKQMKCDKCKTVTAAKSVRCWNKYMKLCIDHDLVPDQLQT